MSKRKSGEISPAVAQLQESPLVSLLEYGVSNNQLVKSQTRKVYTGFANFVDLVSSECRFVPMNSNRAINEAVVQERVEANKESLKKENQFCDFGQIHFVVINTDPSKTFYVMDGQHRCLTMQRLLPLGQPIWFQFRVDVVENEDAAAMKLIHFQNCYPSDPRSFFPSQRMTVLATEVVDLIRQRFPLMFKEDQAVFQIGRGIVDPQRPFLNTNLAFGILKDSKLLEDESATKESVMATIESMNNFMNNLANRQAIHRLGKDATPNMVQKAQGALIGLFREKKLSWGELEDDMLKEGGKRSKGKTKAASAKKSDGDGNSNGRDKKRVRKNN